LELKKLFFTFAVRLVDSYHFSGASLIVNSYPFINIHIDYQSLTK